MLNDKYIKDAEKFKTIEKLSTWLTNVINTFIGYIFEYSNVKHVEVVYKITSYINRNYNKKITLEVVDSNPYNIIIEGCNSLNAYLKVNYTHKYISFYQNHPEKIIIQEDSAGIFFCKFCLSVSDSFLRNSSGLQEGLDC